MGRSKRRKPPRLTRRQRRMVEENDGLAWMWTLRFWEKISPNRRHRIASCPEDLVNEARMGLIKAVICFDPKLGYEFSTYASSCIWSSLVRAIRSSNLIHIPENLFSSIARLNGTSSKEDSEVSEEIVRRARIARRAMKIDQQGDDNYNIDRPGRSKPPDYEFDEIEKLEEHLRFLSERDRDIIRRRWGLAPYERPQTLEDIAETLGLSRERIRQIEDMSMYRLRVRYKVLDNKSRSFAERRELTYRRYTKRRPSKPEVTNGEP